MLLNDDTIINFHRCLCIHWARIVLAGVFVTLNCYIKATRARNSQKVTHNVTPLTLPWCRYEWVYALKRDFPHLDFSLNGGLGSCHQAAAALRHCAPDGGGAAIHGVMIGRAAYNHPWGCLADADVAVFGADRNAALSRRQVHRRSLPASLQLHSILAVAWDTRSPLEQV